MSLNNALVADNPTGLFVTMAHATYDPASGEAVVVLGGHPAPLLRHADGKTEVVQARPAMMLGYTPFDDPPQETRLTLSPGDVLAFYTDGMTEAFTPDRKTMFGVERLRDALAGPAGALPLPQCVESVRRTVAEFTRQPDQQDDQTLLVVRRTEGK
jgi:serine phosphatase RsbU (regulator of sigma subunit)